MEKHSILYILLSFLIAILLVALIVFGVLWFYGDYFNINIRPKKIEPLPEIEIVSGDYDSGDEVIEIVEPEPEEIYTGPKVFSGDSRSIAFMIDNDVKAALPHAGLNDAYMIYEAIVEGGASRLMALFKYDKIPEHIGPIRSCRHYFLDYVQEHDALYYHIGQSTQGGEALKSRGIQDLNGVGYTRIGPDKTWHNAFTVKDKITKEIEKRGWRTKQNQDCILKFNEKDTDLNSTKYADVVTIKFPVSTTVFKYDEEAKTYLVEMKGTPHVDKFTNEQATAKNILIYRIDNKSVWEAWGDHREEDNKKRQEIYNTGTGTGYYITNGKAIEMQWEKLTHASKTKYMDMYGNELKFNDGITWVELVPTNGSYTITDNHKTTSGELRSGE